MSTRCNIHFNHGDDIRANIYRHSDGYPGVVNYGGEVEYGIMSDLLKFFRELKANVPDNRLNSAQYLGAKFLVWQAKEYAVKHEYDADANKWGSTPKHYLDFLSVAPAMQDHGDIEFVYEVDCDKRDAEGFPAVRWKSEGGRFRTVYLCGKPKVDKSA